MAEHIDREAAVKAAQDGADEWDGGYNRNRDAYIECAIDKVPAADVVEVVRGKWEDVHIDRPEIADIEVASMFCPNCNRWHNEVYHYGNPIEMAHYCGFCGAKMDGDNDV